MRRYLFLALAFIATSSHAAEITFTVSSTNLNRIVNAMCDQFNYTENARNNETRAQFAKRMIGEWIKRETVEQEAEKAAALERENTRTAGNSEIVVE